MYNFLIKEEQDYSGWSFTFKERNVLFQAAFHCRLVYPTILNFKNPATNLRISEVHLIGPCQTSMM